MQEIIMTKTVTIRLNDKVYNRFKGLAEQDNRPLSNFIETAALRFVEQLEYVDEFEMEEIQSNISLNTSIKNGLRDAKAGRGRFV
jgi:predicted transcriptional regulator